MTNVCVVSVATAMTQRQRVASKAQHKRDEREKMIFGNLDLQLERAWLCFVEQNAQSAAVEIGIVIDITQHSNLFDGMLIFLKPYTHPCFLKSN